MKNKKTFLVTGGTGFIGRNIVNLLLKKNYKILVLDDVFANLDTPNELKIMEGIPDLARGRTLIIISQQLWYLRHCRKIMFVNQGKVEQFGETQTVISENGPIKNFLEKQLNIVSPKLKGQQNLIFNQ